MFFKKALSLINLTKQIPKSLNFGLSSTTKYIQKNKKQQPDLERIDGIIYPKAEELLAHLDQDSIPKNFFQTSPSLTQHQIQSLDKDQFGEVDRSQTLRAAWLSVQRGNQTFHIFDASKMAMGRVCQKVAAFVRGKHKPIYQKGKKDLGDVCIIVNAGDILLTGKKARKRSVKYHTGFPGGVKVIPYNTMLQFQPEKLLMWSIWKQLPSNLIRRELLSKVVIFRGPHHNYTGLPNFVQQTNKFEYSEQYQPANVLLDDDTKLIKIHGQKIEPELEHLEQIEDDQEIFIPFKDRQKIFKWTPHNKKADKAWRLYYKRLDRVRVVKPKIARKFVLPQDRTDDFALQNDKQLKRYKIPIDADDGDDGGEEEPLKLKF